MLEHYRTLTVIACVSLGLIASAEEAPPPEPCCIIIDFDDAEPGECLNTRYEDLGIRFERPDGACVFAKDWPATGYATPTPPIVLSSEAGPGVPTHSDSVEVVNVNGERFGIQACVGNDPLPGARHRLFFLPQGGWTTIRLNGNFHVDQAIGTGRSAARYRLQHLETDDPIALDSLLINRCPESRQCSIGPETEPGRLQCSPEPPLPGIPL